MHSFFGNIVGNDAARKRIGLAIQESVLPHAILITGDEGSGKTLFAKEIAAAVNCESKNTSGPLPCHRCNTCKRISEDNFLDVRLLKRRDDKATVGITEVREHLSDVALSGAESDNRFYIIDDAHLMTVQAQNSLLKVLEEPPEGVYIILLAEQGDKLLTTIKSRVQAVAMSRFSDEEVDAYLMERSDNARLLKRSDPDGYFGAVASAEGSLGRAVTLMNKRSIEDARGELELTKKLIRAFVPRAPYTAVREAVYSLPMKRQELAAALERTVDAVNELLSAKYSRHARVRIFRDETERQALLRDIGSSRLIAIYELMLELLDDCSKNANVSAMLSKLTGRIRREQ